MSFPQDRNYFSRVEIYVNASHPNKSVSVKQVGEDKYKKTAS